MKVATVVLRNRRSELDSNIRGLLFDLDNTLIDREAAFIRFATSFYNERLQNATSMSQVDAVAQMVCWDEDGYVDRGEMFARWVNEWPDAGLEPAQLLPWYQSEMKRHVQPDTDNNRLLADLNRRTVPWGIVTNGSTQTQRIACRSAGLDKLAPFVIVSEAAGYKKPDPRIFRDALNRTGLSSPEHILFVGDNPIADIDGAKRFGMKTAWVRRGRQFPDELQSPDYVVDHVAELRDVLRTSA
ncbi:MAG: HAD family hydrolase [Chloroflexi bacterium]|nr:HAD family hydrolase [Chloroflexota bacterium]